MSLFVDASAFVSMIGGEPDQNDLLALLNDEADPLWSAMSCWETISGLRSSHGWSIHDARAEVEALVEQRPFRLVPIAEAERALALNAYSRYGRGSGHPAKLHFGNCFAYACAKANGAGLLYKGDDFALTDLA